MRGIKALSVPYAIEQVLLIFSQKYFETQPNLPIFPQRAIRKGWRWGARGMDM